MESYLDYTLKSMIKSFFEVVLAKEINILGIETSCDETACAVVADGRKIKSCTPISEE